MQLKVAEVSRPCAQLLEQLSRDDLSGCLRINGGYYSDIYTWNKNYDVLVKRYNHNVHGPNKILPHLHDHEVLRALGHLPNIPELIAYNDKYCVMTRVSGQTLQECDVDMLRLNRDNIVRAVYDFAYKAKDAGYVVNDLNLGNILLERNGKVNIIDFNAYLEIPYFVDQFIALNNSTGLFDVNLADIHDYEAIEVFIHSRIDRLKEDIDERLWRNR